MKRVATLLASIVSIILSCQTVQSQPDAASFRYHDTPGHGMSWRGQMTETYNGTTTKYYYETYLMDSDEPKDKLHLTRCNEIYKVNSNAMQCVKGVAAEFDYYSDPQYKNQIGGSIHLLARRFICNAIPKGNSWVCPGDCWHADSCVGPAQSIGSSLWDPPPPMQSAVEYCERNRNNPVEAMRCHPK